MPAGRRQSIFFARQSWATPRWRHHAQRRRRRRGSSGNSGAGTSKEAAATAHCFFVPPPPPPPPPPPHTHTTPPPPTHLVEHKDGHVFDDDALDGRHVAGAHPVLGGAAVEGLHIGCRATGVARQEVRVWEGVGSTEAVPSAWWCCGRRPALQHLWVTRCGYATEGADSGTCPPTLRRGAHRLAWQLHTAPRFTTPLQEGGKTLCARLCEPPSDLQPYPPPPSHAPGHAPWATTCAEPPCASASWSPRSWLNTPDRMTISSL